MAHRKSFATLLALTKSRSPSCFVAYKGIQLHAGNVNGWNFFFMTRIRERRIVVASYRRIVVASYRRIVVGTPSLPPTRHPKSSQSTVKFAHTHISVKLPITTFGEWDELVTDNSSDFSSILYYFNPNLT